MIMEDNTRYITGRIWGKILPPALISNLFVLISLHFGMFFLVSRFCPKPELVIYSAFLPFWALFAVFECIFAVAGAQYFSIFKGAGNHLAAQRAFAEILTMQLLLLIVGSLLGAWQMPNIVQFFGIPQESVPLAIKYGRLLVVCGLVDVTVTMLRQFIQADSLPRTGAIIATSQATFLVLGMYVCFCILHCGLLAYYWFFLCCSFITVCIDLVFFLCGKTTLKLQLGRMRWQTCKGLGSLASNAIITKSGEFFVSMLITRWVMEVFGPAALTIYALLSLLAGCGDCLQKGYIASTQLLTGVYRGEENGNGIRIVCRKGFFDGLYPQLGLALFLFFFPEVVCRCMPVLENFPGEAALAVQLSALSIPFRYAFCFLSGYYVVCGYDKLMTFCSLVGDIFLYFLVMVFYLLILKDERLCWWYALISWGLALCFLLIAVQRKKRREGFSDFLLIPQKKPAGKRFYFLLKDRPEDFQDYRTMLGAFLRKQAVEAKPAARIGHLFEELFLFAREQVGNRENALFSIVITIFDRSVELALRYDSRESCLKSALSGEQATVLAPEQVAGAKLLSRLSDGIYIDRIYGINYVRLTLNRN